MPFRALVKSGVIRDKQQYRCKSCGYHFTRDSTRHRVSKDLILKALGYTWKVYLCVKLSEY